MARIFIPFASGITAVLAMMAGCATVPDSFDDRFDPAWMNVVLVERSALPAMCHRLDEARMTACAQPYKDRGGQSVPQKTAGHGTCNIYMARDLIRDSDQFVEVLRHEAKHCRGWRHFRD
jgi:hypothetical protein